MTDTRIEIKIDGAKCTAKGVQYQAAPFDTVTGISWVLQGDLADGLARWAEHRVDFDSVGEAAYFASVWGLTAAQMQQLEHAFDRALGRNKGAGWSSGQ